LESLGVEPPTVFPRVSDHISEIIAYIIGIEKRGLSYCAQDGVYFDTIRFGSQYGKLAPFKFKSAEELRGNVGPVSTEVVQHSKRAASDFALWKLSKPGEPR
jgi:cysteinyl-tRNA synthetase